MAVLLGVGEPIHFGGWLDSKEMERVRTIIVNRGHEIPDGPFDDESLRIAKNLEKTDAP